MSYVLTLNGQTFTLPSLGDTGWVNEVNNYFSAISTGVLQKSGGTFTLTADVNFGATYGVVSEYFKSNNANISTTGELRLATTDVISWRNGANDGNLNLSVATDKLFFNSQEIVTTTGGQVIPVAQGGTNITSYTVGDILYASGTTTLSKLAGNTSTTRKKLVQTGNGSVSAAPEWIEDIGSYNHFSTYSVTATGGQTVVTGIPTYTVGTNGLKVFVNGLYQAVTDNYTETSSTSITFNSGLLLNDVVDFWISDDQAFTVTKYTATGGQTVFAVPFYVVGTNSIMVFINGVYQASGPNYTETDSETITLTSGASLNDKVVIISGIPVSTELTANNISFAIASGPSGSVQEALEGIVTERTAGEIAAGVTPTNYYYPPGDVRRYGAVGDGVTDDTQAIQNAFDAATAEVGGGKVTITGASATFGIGDTVIIKSNTHVVFESWIKLLNSTSTGGIMGTEEGSTNIYIENVLIDGNDIYTGGSGENGFGFGGSKHRMVGGIIKNCARGLPNGDGGKGIQNETEYNDIIVTGVTFDNCFMAISSRQEHILHAYECGPQIFSNITFQNCPIIWFADYSGVGSVPDGQKYTAILTGFSAKECGSFEGALQFNNATNVLVSNGIITNGGFTTPAFIRGRHRYCRFENLQFAGDCTGVINNATGTYCPLTAASEQNYYNFNHIGTISTLVGSAAETDRALTNSTLICRIDTNPSSGIADSFVKDTSTYCEISLDAKHIRGTLTYISDNIPTFSSFSWNGDVLANCEAGSWDPVITSSAGTITTVGTTTGKYTKIGRMVVLEVDTIIIDNGTGSGYIVVETDTGAIPLPTHIRAPLAAVGSGVDVGITNQSLTMSSITLTDLAIVFYDNSYPGANNARLKCTMIYTLTN